MAIIDFPAGIPLRAVNWRQSGGVVRNRSEFTGKTRELRIGPSARWTCDLEFVPTNSVTALNLLREFLADMAQPGDGFRLQAVETAQAVAPVPVTCLVNGANQLGQTLNLDGLQASVTNLPAGAMISVPITTDDRQLIVLRSALTANGSGQAAATLATPLRGPPADNAVVQVHFPVAAMRLSDSAVNWAVSPGGVYDFQRLTAEEFF